MSNVLGKIGGLLHDWRVLAGFGGFSVLNGLFSHVALKVPAWEPAVTLGVGVALLLFSYWEWRDDLDELEEVQDVA